MRTVRAWSEPWANDPLPGPHYIRLTANGVATADLGLPVDTEVRADSEDTGGSAAVDGSPAEPLVPGIATKSEDQQENAAVPAGLRPEDGWVSGWWSDRWVWTAVGGVPAALAGSPGTR